MLRKKKGECKMKKYVIIVICILVVVVLGFFGYQMVKPETTDTQLTKVRVNEVTRSIFYAPQYVALNKGFFKEEGLDIEFTTAEGSDKVMTAILSGQADIGLAGPETSIYVSNEGKEDYTQVFAQLTKRDGSFLVSKTKQDNFSWQNLKGTTVIPGRKGGAPYMTFEYVVKKNGLVPQKDVILDDSIKFDLMAGAFAGGDAEYVTLFEPTATMTEQAGKGYIVASVGEAAGEMPFTGYTAKKSYIESHEDIIQKFTNAIYKGQQYVQEHTAREIAESIQDYFPSTDLDLLETVIQRYKDIDVWNDTPILKKEAFDLLQNVMQEAGELEQRAPYEKVVNNKYAEKAVQEN